MDLALKETCDQDQFIKCVNIALMCAQDDPNDLPTMLDIVAMLDGDIATIPAAKDSIVLRTHSGTTSGEPEIRLQSETNDPVSCV